MRIFLMGVLRDSAGEGNQGGGGDGNQPQYVTAADLAKHQAEITKMLNGVVVKFEKLVKSPEQKSQADPEPNPDPNPAPGKKDPATLALERQLAKLQSDLAAEQTARKSSDEKAKSEKRDGALRTELLKFVPADRVDAAMRIFGPDVKYTEDGLLVGGSEEKPLGEFVSSQMSSPAFEYLLPPKPISGAGAGNHSGGRRGTSTVQLEDIKSGMSAETSKAALEQIRAALPR